MALTKNVIVEQLQAKLGFPKNQSVELVESPLELIKSTLKSGDDVLVSGFGKFCVREKTERKGRNPATGDDTILPARRVVTFKCSGKLREKINKLKENNVRKGFFEHGEFFAIRKELLEYLKGFQVRLVFGV